MKRILVFIAAATLAVTMAACANKDKQQSASAPAKLSSREDSLMTLIDAARKSSQAASPAILNQKQMDSALVATTGSSAPEAKTTRSLAPNTAKSSAKVASDSSSSMSKGINSQDTAGSLDAAVKKNAAVIVVDSGSKEDKRLDSLMRLSQEIGYKYQALVMNHTHKSLAEAAHQDPVKQRRLLQAIYAAKAKRQEAVQHADSARAERMKQQNMDVGEY